MGLRRRALISILIYCEGLHDYLFVRHLQQVYKPPDSPYFFDIKKGAGGSPRSLVEKAAKISGSYDRRLVVCDNDKGEEAFKQALSVASEKKVEIIPFKPCLEAAILDILEPGYNASRRTTEECKRRLHQWHMDKAKRSNPERYAIIKRVLIDKAGVKNQSLRQLMELLKKSG